MAPVVISLFKSSKASGILLQIFFRYDRPEFNDGK